MKLSVSIYFSPSLSPLAYANYDCFLTNAYEYDYSESTSTELCLPWRLFTCEFQYLGCGSSIDVPLPGYTKLSVWFSFFTPTRISSSLFCSPTHCTSVVSMVSLTSSLRCYMQDRLREADVSSSYVSKPRQFTFLVSCQ